MWSFTNRNAWCNLSSCLPMKSGPVYGSFGCSNVSMGSTGSLPVNRNMGLYLVVSLTDVL